MKITNQLGLPDAIVQAIVNDDYHRGECELSVTQLIAPPRQVELMRQHENEIEEDAADRIWLLMGKIAHGILEKAETDESALTEERLFVDIDGWRVSGAFDHLTVSQHGDDTWKLSDYKVTSVWSAKNAASKGEWIQQLNSYAYMLRQHSFVVSELEIVAICRDWRKADAFKHAADGYPQHQVAVIKLPLWPSRVTREFMEERVRLHRAARETLPFCTDEERWKRNESWALMKDGRKTAVRVFTSAGDAFAAAKADPKLRVEKRSGVATRCQDYCSVRTFCVLRNDGQHAPGDINALG